MTIIFSGYSGSYLYGTNTPESDLDIRRVEIESVEYILGLLRKDHTVINGEKDETTFTLRFFANLALASNPNILELIFVDRLAIGVSWSKDWDKFITVAKSYIPSQLVRKTFAGYAVSQLKRIETHYRWINSNSPPLPKPENYGRIIIGDGEKWTDYQLKQKYDADKKHYDQYQTWVKNRNPKRSELEKKYGYDCYTNDTEFLTLNGWLGYDEITDNHLLGTVNPITKKLEFQFPTDRIKKPYSGVIYSIGNKYSECNVTPNHRMFISDVHRGLLGAEYDENMSNWRFEKLQLLLDRNRSYYHILNSITPNDIDYNISDELLLLIGAYVSEGGVGFYNGIPDEIRITQTNRGKSKFFDYMDKISKIYKCNRYDYIREEKDLTETTWIFRDKELIEYLVFNCGVFSKNKKLFSPLVLHSLSKRQCLLLLDVLYLGDGTEKKMGYVYYTNSKRLADDVFLLGFLAGKDTKIYGPYRDKRYDTEIYQVYFTKDDAKPKSVILNKKTKRMKYNGSIVCFTVPNENLITMVNGKIAIQGNTKHAMHLVRLITEAHHLLTAGYLEFPLPNADFLREVRNGYFTYPDLIKYSDEMLEKIKTMKSDLPLKPNFEKVQDVIIDIYRRYV